MVTLETVAFRADHDDWPTFQRYLREEGLTEFEKAHLDRGLPKSGFAERYTRYAKALIQAGPVSKQDTDRDTGMKLELTSGANPYVEDLSELPVTLTWKGAPLAGRQINVFYHNDSAVTPTRLVTDKNGRVIIRLSGPGEYLLNAVHLEPDDSPPIAWASHWATLSFRL